MATSADPRGLTEQVPAPARTVKAWIVQKPGKPFELGDVTLPPLAHDQVEVKVTHCGMCASDVDAADGKFGDMVKFPGVCGHEGIGIVTQVGACVTSTKVGARVGIACYRGFCGICLHCTCGNINLCTQRRFTLNDGPNTQPGGFSTYVRLNATCAIPIPDGVDSADAAPLMCAGTTVFAPFRNHNIRSGESVGVIGIGGLGSLAIQLGRAHGCEMVAMSSSHTKKDLCLKKLGAHRYIDMSNQDEMKANVGRLNYILVTAPSASLDWTSLFEQLAHNGKIILLGVIREPFPINSVPMIMGQKSICGSCAGSVGLTIDLLRFAALHKIHPLIEKYPFSKINDVVAKLKKNEIRFRAVLEHHHE